MQNSSLGHISSRKLAILMDSATNEFFIIMGEKLKFSALIKQEVRSDIVGDFAVNGAKIRRTALCGRSFQLIPPYYGVLLRGGSN